MSPYEYTPANKCPNTIVTESTLAEWIAARLRWNVQRGAQGRFDPALLRAQYLQSLEQDPDARERAARDWGVGAA